MELNGTVLRRLKMEESFFLPKDTVHRIVILVVLHLSTGWQYKSERKRECLNTNTHRTLGYLYKTVGSRSRMLSRNSDFSLNY